jgi:hypothetical protein
MNETKECNDVAIEGWHDRVESRAHNIEVSEEIQLLFNVFL